MSSLLVGICNKTSGTSIYCGWMLVDITNCTVLQEEDAEAYSLHLLIPMYLNCCHVTLFMLNTIYMLRPDSQPLTRFETGQSFLTRFEARCRV